MRARDREIVDSESHSGICRVARIDGDVPSEVEVAAGLESGVENVADRDSFARDNVVTGGFAIGGEVGVEIVACGGEIATVDRVVELHCKTGGVASFAVFFYVVADD